jgi:acid phosphatase type 7
MTKFNYFFLVFFLYSHYSVAKTDKYRLTIRSNPSSSIVVCWNQISGEDPIVYYGKDDEGIQFKKYKYNHKADRVVLHHGMNNHFARLDKLKADTRYYFVIKDSEGTSERFWFKTAPSKNDKLSFLAGGDSRNNRLPRQHANLLVSKLKPHAVLFGGDMTARDIAVQWKDWMDDWQLTTSKDGRMIPIIATRGNHERANTSIYNLFDTPSKDVYFAITFGKNLFRTYTLNSMIAIEGNQTEWLKKDLKKNKNIIWKLAQYHKPMRPHVAMKREHNLQYAAWAELFYDEEVRLVVECDAHTVKTTWPLKPSTASNSEEGFIREDKKGTVYVGEGCWGAPLRTNNDNKSWTRDSGKFNQIKWIFVSKSKIECRTVIVENSKDVKEVLNSNTFEIPENLKIWTPKNGAVVEIHK